MKQAIIQNGGKQYAVKVGDIVKLEKFSANENEEIELTDVLLVFDEKEKEFNLGTPTIEKAKVKVKVLEQGRAKKVLVLKYKPKIRYKKKIRP